MATDNTGTTAMKTATIKDFCAERGFTQLGNNNSVGITVKGVTFVTFINAENVAENIHFSKGSTAVAGEAVTKELLEGYQIVYTTNAQGEHRIKLGRKGGNRVLLTDLF